MDKVREDMAAKTAAGRGRLRKSASHLVLGQGTTGAFNVVMANDLAEEEEEEEYKEGDEDEYGEAVPRPKVNRKGLR